MLQYLRDNKYKNELGIEVPFFDDTGYNKFMEHVRYEQKLKNAVNASEDGIMTLKVFCILIHFVIY